MDQFAVSDNCFVIVLNQLTVVIVSAISALLVVALHLSKLVR